MIEKTQAPGFWPNFYEPLRGLGAKIADWIAPASASDAYSIAIELPGVSEDDIHLTVERGMVNVRGEKQSYREDRDDTWYFSERQFGAFLRSFRLPADADETNVEASLKDGVLTIRVARRAATAQGGKRVKINAGA
jgi:HSP20 family protein